MDGYVSLFILLMPCWVMMAINGAKPVAFLAGLVFVPMWWIFYTAVGQMGGDKK